MSKQEATEKRVQRAYDAMAPEWNEMIMENPLYWYKEIVRLAGKVREGEILDIGCGLGREGFILSRHPVLSYTGIDLSSGVLHESQKKGIPRLSVMNARELAFPNEFFSGFWAASVFIHFNRKSTNDVLKEIYRVCKPEAYGIIATEIGDGIQKITPDRPEWSEFSLPITLWQEDQFQDVLYKNGFLVRECHWVHNSLVFDVMKRS